ncbi:MAG: metalloregulator ArsR/SmtB family transcription factor [bacterium]|nr:metalloregulator ArsR/SmtB family transcription factor [bacterium]
MMDKDQWQDLLLLLKTLADEQRLTMIGLMNDQERTVSEMAGLLKLTEPTVSHHISKLHHAGLLHLRMEGNSRFYRLNERRMAKFKAYVAEIETPPTEVVPVESDNAWIEALDWASEEDKKVLRDYTFDGRLTQLPTKEKKWLTVLRWLATRFETDRRYTEKEVNAVLTEIHRDYATLRRDLVGFGFMARQNGGGEYWRVEPEEEGA